MRALTAEQRADREYEARVQKWSKAVKAAQQAVRDYEATEPKLVAKNDSERRRIEEECAARVLRWRERLTELEQDLDKSYRSRPAREVL